MTASSAIRDWHYDPATRTLAIVFASGRRYRYAAVPAAVAAGLAAAESQGRYFNARIRDRYAYERAARRLDPAP